MLFFLLASSAVQVSWLIATPSCVVRKVLLVIVKGPIYGPDYIHNQMLYHLSSQNLIYLLHIFNLFLENGFAPLHWKEATIIPLLQPDKPPTNPASHRPISLTFYLCKLFERIVKSRLNQHIEQSNLLPTLQAGFRSGRSTTDHIVTLETSIKQGFVTQQNSHAVFLEISKAYDSVWLVGLLTKLTQVGIAGNMLRWLHSFLIGRSSRIRIGHHLSEPHPLTSGVPQGAVLSPLLFNIMLYDFPRPTQSSQTLLYADDIIITCHAKTSATAEAILQPELDRIGRWGDKWGFRFSAQKSAVLVFKDLVDPYRHLLFTSTPTPSKL